MKLSHALTLVGLGIGATGIVVATQGCSSDPAVSTPPADVGREPQKPAGAAQTTSTAEHNYALHKLLLGDTDRAGVANANAWKKYGYNLDAKQTTKDSADVCKLAAGAGKNTQIDGDNGVDNSFGQNILPIILTTGLDDANATQTAIGLKGMLLAGGKFSETAKPTWTKSDDWPVRPEILTDQANPKSSKVQFPDAYRVNGTFVNGTRGSLQLSLAIGGVSLDININQAVVTMDVKSPGKATNGIIAGIINTEELINGLKKVAGRISTSLCSGSAFDSIAQQIRQASDIMANGTNAAGADCNGISIGLGFEGDEIGIPTKVAGLGTPDPDPCTASDAGTD
jgi:hypothetical protein